MKRRELQSDDLYELLGILSKIGIKEMIGKVFDAREQNQGRQIDEKEMNSLGFDLVGDIIGCVLQNSSKAKVEINNLLACLYDVRVEEIKCLSLGSYSKMLVELFMSSDMKDFLHSMFSFKEMMNSK